MKEQILVEGNLYDPQKIKGEYLRIGKEYYFYHSDKLVRVRGRMYRKASPLLCRTSDGNWELKRETVKLADGAVFAKDSRNVAQVGEQYYHRHEVVEIRHRYYLREDERIFICPLSGRCELRENGIQLSELHYGPNYYIMRDIMVVVMTPDGYCLHKDCIDFYKDSHNKEHYHRHSHIFKGRELIDVAIGRNEPNDYFNPRTGKALKDEAVWVFNKRLGCYMHRSWEASFDERFEAWFQEAGYPQMRKQLLTRGDANNRENVIPWKVSEPGENQEQYIDFSPHFLRARQDGAFVQGKQEFQYSKSRYRTGGLGYTFGLEWEVSAGRLPDVEIKRLGLALMGDSSVGAGEYVSAPLHGDLGVKQMEDICASLSQRTWVDDRCGLHIHIGGAQDEQGRKTDMPVFNRRFSINAILLGAQLEDELFASCPPSRNYRKKYCKGITDYADINDKNWRKRLGEYVFEHPYAPYGEHSMINSHYALGRWCDGRYKWLNLVNCNSRGRFKTIEFRIFAGTTSFEKSYQYLLLCLAFTWFVENRQKAIRQGGLTLAHVLQEALPKRLADSCIQFFEQRKQHFAPLRQQAGIDRLRKVEKVVANNPAVDMAEAPDEPLRPRNAWENPWMHAVGDPLVFRGRAAAGMNGIMEEARILQRQADARLMQALMNDMGAGGDALDPQPENNNDEVAF